MLELRPSCEHCNQALPPTAENARICSFECTFCAACVTLLENVCPNCGGGFSPRPIRPTRNHKGDNCTAHYPPSNTVKHRPVDLAAHAESYRTEHNTVRPHEHLSWNRPIEVHLGLADPTTPTFPEPQNLPSA